MTKTYSDEEARGLVGDDLFYRVRRKNLVKWIKIALSIQLVMVGGGIAYYQYQEESMDQWQCVLKNLGDAKSDQSAGLLARACRELYQF